MLSFSLFLAFILSFVFPEWRQKLVLSPLQAWSDWLIRTFSLQDSRWLPVALILPLLLGVSLLEDWFDDLLFLLVFTYVAWVVIDVQAIDRENGDETQETVFASANSALFCGAMWFVLIHPLVAVGYRLMVWMAENEELSGHDEWSSTLAVFRSWIEWPASFLAALCIALVGKIQSGLRQLMLLPIFGDDLTQLNRTRVLRSGEAALGDDITDQAARTNAAKQLVNRGFTAALVLLLLIELLI